MSTSDTKVPLTLEQVRITAAFLQTSLSANETSWRNAGSNTDEIGNRQGCQILSVQHPPLL